MTDPLLRMSGISKRFPGVLALDDVSFEVAPGEVHGLLGENGAGKSTLLKILSGAEQPDSGSIALEVSLLRCAARPMRIVLASSRSTRNSISFRR
jgi:ABC-type sugar transport system ATPase subunit